MWRKQRACGGFICKNHTLSIKIILYLYPSILLCTCVVFVLLRYKSQTDPIKTRVRLGRNVDNRGEMQEIGCCGWVANTVNIALVWVHSANKDNIFSSNFIFLKSLKIQVDNKLLFHKKMSNKTRNTFLTISLF